MAEVVIGFECDVFCFVCWLDEIGDGAEGKADPGDDDGPAFDATMAVDALFERGELEDFVHGELALGFDFAFYGNGPRRSAKFLSVFGGLIFVDAELVEVIVVGDFFEGVLLFGGAEGAFGEIWKFTRGENAARGRGEFEKIFAGNGGGSSEAHGLEEFTPVEVDVFRCDVGVR